MKNSPSQETERKFIPKVQLAPIYVPKPLADAAKKKSKKTRKPLAEVQREALERWVGESELSPA